MDKLEQLINELRDFFDLPTVLPKRAGIAYREVVDEIARLQAIEQAARDVLPTIGWWSDGYDDAAVYRCVGCDVERDDVQSGTDKHHESCRVGKLIAALDGAK